MAPFLSVLALILSLSIISEFWRNRVYVPAYSLYTLWCILFLYPLVYAPASASTFRRTRPIPFGIPALYLLVYSPYTPPCVFFYPTPYIIVQPPMTEIVLQGIVTDLWAHKHRLDWFRNQLDSPLIDTGICENLIQHAVAIANYTHYILYPSDVSLVSDEVC